MLAVSKNKKTLLLFLCIICLGVLASYFFYRERGEDDEQAHRHVLVIGKNPTQFASRNLHFLEGPNTSLWYVNECHKKPTKGKLKSTHINLSGEATSESLNDIIACLEKEEIKLDGILTEKEVRLYKLAADLRTQHNIVGTKASDLAILPKISPSAASLSGEKRYHADVVVRNGTIEDLAVKSVCIDDLSHSFARTVSIDVSSEKKQSIRAFVENHLQKWDYKHGGLSMELHDGWWGYRIAALLPYTSTMLTRQMHEINIGLSPSSSSNSMHYQALISFSDRYGGQGSDPNYRQLLSFGKEQKPNKNTLKSVYPELKTLQSSSGAIEYDAQHGSHIPLADQLEVVCTDSSLQRLQEGVEKICKDMKLPFADVILKASLRNGQTIYEKASDKGRSLPEIIINGGMKWVAKVILGVAGLSIIGSLVYCKALIDLIRLMIPSH